jgi:hypothetical protein
MVLAELRSVKAIQTDYAKVIDAMETHLEAYKKSKGTPAEKEHIQKLKTLTTQKKKLADELNAKVSDMYKDAELKVDEMNTTGNVGGYGTPFAFSGKDSEEKKGKRQADLTGYSVVKEGKYYVSYNRGRGQGKDLEKEFDPKTFKTTGKPKVFSSYNDAKKYAEKMEKMFQHSIGGGTAYWVSDEKMNPIKEAKAPYEVYHKSYTSAIEAAREYAEKKGFEIDNDDAFTKIGMGPRKPSEGKTNKFSIQLSKDGKLQRKQLHIQVYGMKNSYELNAYIG